MRRLHLCRLLLLALALAGLSLPAMAQTGQVVRVAVEGAYPPFNELGKDGKLKGFDVDIAQALCADMQVSCKLVRQSWDQIQEGLLRNESDAIISSLSINDSRRMRYDFTTKYYQTPARFVGRKDVQLDMTPAGMMAKRIGVQRKTTHEAFLRDNFGNSLQLQTFQTLPEATAALAAGKLDLVLGDSLALYKGFLSAKGGQPYAFIGPSITDRRWFGEGVGIAVRKGDGQLREAFNQSIQRIRANGTYAQIARRYFDFDIYGN